MYMFNILVVNILYKVYCHNVDRHHSHLVMHLMFYFEHLIITKVKSIVSHLNLLKVYENFIATVGREMLWLQNILIF